MSTPINSYAGHTIKIENSKANLYDRDGNLLGAYPHRQQAEAHVYIFNHGYQHALGDVGRELGEMFKAMDKIVDKLSFSSEPVYPPDDKEEQSVQDDIDELRTTSKEMSDWGLELCHNYSNNMWMVFESTSRGSYAYDVWVEIEKWELLVEWFNKFKKEHPERYNPK